MHPLFSYDLYIFDCDGVILNANQLKIKAMGQAVRDSGFSDDISDKCELYFANNFGMSRFHHIRYFVENLFQIEKVEHELVYDEVLKRFSELCRQEYKHAEKTPKFDLMFKSLDGNKAVASGSEQKELIKLFQDRGMSDGFEKILGSPTSKVENVKNILDSIPHSKPVMIGDAVADFKAALENDIDFIGYIPFSNVPEEMINLSEKYDFLVLDKWPILGECK